VDRRIHDGLRTLTVLNPLRSEQDAFRVLLYVIAVFAVIIVVIEILHAIL
jgi:hypothetical protein